VSLTWGGIKRLVRLHAMAEQLAQVARHGHDPERSPGSGRRLLDELLAELVDETHEVLRDADADLAGEFERIVGANADARLSLAIRASLLAGWLAGAVEAETLEVGIRTGVGGKGPASRSATRHNGG
jgi:hypothetical protein